MGGKYPWQWRLQAQFGGQFTEDGSFIGQYVPGQLQPPVSPQPVHNQQQQPPLSQGSNAVATYV